MNQAISKADRKRFMVSLQTLGWCTCVALLKHRGSLMAMQSSKSTKLMDEDGVNAAGQSKQPVTEEEQEEQ